MSLEELKKLKKDVAKAIETYEARHLSEARAKLEAQAKELGYSLDDVVGASKTGSAKRLPKYRHPEDATLTWTGMGRKPKWFIDALEAGMSKEDLKI
ncbi:H-NS family nucleoid-associated regulatory protein [Roseovarius tibetensis]|uniref:H-NS histone family protein n=1 Tax=Roseovarius tibetensis TaxID=2685897 RepID=UPI003D7F8EAA